MTESGKRVRYSLTHPDQLSKDFDGARDFVQRKAGVVTDQVHIIIDKAKRGIEEGERGYHEAGEYYRAQVRKIERKNNEIASNVHSTVDNVKSTAVDIQKGALDPLCELGALFRGVQRGIRTLLGKGSPRDGLFSFNREKRFPGM
jgi:hypothetical protein